MWDWTTFKGQLCDCFNATWTSRLKDSLALSEGQRVGSVSQIVLNTYSETGKHIGKREDRCSTLDDIYDSRQINPHPRLRPIHAKNDNYYNNFRILL